MQSNIIWIEIKGFKYVQDSNADENNAFAWLLRISLVQVSPKNNTNDMYFPIRQCQKDYLNQVVTQYDIFGFHEISVLSFDLFCILDRKSVV